MLELISTPENRKMATKYGVDGYIKWLTKQLMPLHGLTSLLKHGHSFKAEKRFLKSIKGLFIEYARDFHRGNHLPTDNATIMSFLDVTLAHKGSAEGFLHNINSVLKSKVRAFKKQDRYAIYNTTELRALACDALIKSFIRKTDSPRVKKSLKRKH